MAEVLDGDHVHLTAHEVHARAVERLPEISRATVYNFLGELVSQGELLEVSTDDRAKRYDPNAHHPHHHLICVRCGAMRDVPPARDLLSELPEPERSGYTVFDVELTYRGICPHCAI
ncbi:transcriptional repressor [Streptomyces capillispiralis]|uniref:Fur family ferric uptake transcriptional regulator n=1 Tax=Streptomyces capillispiralis TaxID=68182 RepID=A0A561SGR3_9ACTN|nr:Fur family ferric uptake transcriptional regulator [Streptomyces capillispiralis]GHH96303.1 transcriptional repressor [Streptomyces capillispiralis]